MFWLLLTPYLGLALSVSLLFAVGRVAGSDRGGGQP